MSAKENLGNQFVPQKYHDIAWEASLEPSGDREYVRTTGEPELLPGHWHIRNGGKDMASSLCRGRHQCPPETQRFRADLAREMFLRDLGRGPVG